jgi:uncharacterized damage-inducible protein DinB
MQKTDTAIKRQLIDAWQTNNRMNLLFIDNITDDGMQKTLSTRGGRTVYEQLVHVHNVRLGWIEVAAKDIFTKYKPLDKDAPYDKKGLRKSFEESSKAIEELIERSWNEGGKVKGFKKGLIPMIAYFLAHEGHHRGHAMLTLKQTGVKLPDSLKWGLWEWNK